MWRTHMNIVFFSSTHRAGTAHRSEHGAQICFSDSCSFNKQLKMLIQSRPNLQSHHKVLPKNFYFWSPSEHQVSGRHHFLMEQFLTATWNRFIDFCPWKARSSLFPDEMSQESNMSSCRGFAAVSRHLVARLSEHVRERGPHGSCRSVIAGTKTFYLVPGTNSRRCP